MHISLPCVGASLSNGFDEIRVKHHKSDQDDVLVVDHFIRIKDFFYNFFKDLDNLCTKIPGRLFQKLSEMKARQNEEILTMLLSIVHFEGAYIGFYSKRHKLCVDLQ